MILYDDKHNFLGMSSHTLGFLGYEDIEDFLSMHNDFANLFINKEGFIYNYDNFNWIDFVLYSGASNKSAIITLKNGKETKVDLSIKEVHLGHELNGIKKLYSVKVISDKFHEISGVPKNTEGAGGIGSFSLGGLVENASSKDVVEKEIEVEKNEVQSPLMQEMQQEETKSENFVLNIAQDDDAQPTKNLVEEPTSSDNQDDFKLNFLNNDTESQNSTNSSDFVLKQPESKEIEQDSDFKLDLLKDGTTEESSNFALKQEDSEEVEESNDFKLDLLKDDTKESSEFMPKQEDNNLQVQETVETVEKDDFQFNLLKDEETPKEEDNTLEIKEQEKQNVVEDSGFKLDFLNTSLESKSEQDKELLIETTSSELPLGSENKTEIIQQIQNDIKEIDATDEVKQDEKPESKELVFDIPTAPQIEQPLNLEQEKSLSNLQIQENKSKDINKSFTNTLQGLFGNKNNFEEEKIEDDSIKEAFSFNLKSDKEEKVEEVKEDSVENIVSFTTETEPKIVEDIIPNTTSESKFASLSALGLSPDDEFDLLNDFITDTKESIDTIEQFTKTKDFDKINYSLVKIKSSAEILNLNDIIDGANNIRKYCITEDSEKVIIETEKLKENIAMLEKHLEATAI